MALDLSNVGMLLWPVLKYTLKALAWAMLVVVFAFLLVVGAIGFFLFSLLAKEYIGTIFVLIGLVFLGLAIWVWRKDKAEARAKAGPP